MAVASLLVLSACPNEDPICDTSITTSVNVSVADEAGDPIPEATVRYRVDGGEQQDCFATGETWACGEDVQGLFEIEASSPDHFMVVEEVQIFADECHVIPAELTLTLEDADCPPVESSPAVELRILADGQPLEPGDGVWAQWGHADADAAPSDCEPLGNGSFACGWNDWGNIELYAGMIGFYPAYETVEVTWDGCEPVTEVVEIELTPSTTACTEEVVSSVNLEVTDEDGQSVSDASASFTLAYLEMLAAEECESFGDGQFQCGQETPGIFELEVQAPGYETAWATASVITDECHVITQDVVVQLQES